MSALAFEQFAPKSFLDSVWKLRKDKRWVKNTKVSAVLWLLNFILLGAGIHTVANKVVVTNGLVSKAFAVNAALSILWDILWYFVNRHVIWPDRQVTARRSVHYTFRGWLLFFAINQSAFWLLTGHANIDWYYAKPALTGLSIVCGLARYIYNDRRTFAEKTATA